MSGFANTQSLEGSDASYSVPENQPKRSWLQRVRDWLWGYDFFVSYHWASGGPYAVNLAQRLRDAKYDVFLDRAEYAMGDDWKKVGAYALSNTQRLILVATREAVTDSKPVEREVQLFTDKNRQIIPIVFGDDLQELDWKKLEVLSRMEDSMLRISEDVHNLASGPSDAAIDQLVKTHGLMRRRTLRRWIISVLIILISVSALVAGYQWQVAVEEARKANLQLARYYLQQGIFHRDEEEDLLKASSYYFRAATAGSKAGDYGVSTNAQIAGEYLARYLPRPRMRFNHGKKVKGATLNADNRRLVTWGKGSVRFWDSLTGELTAAPITLEKEVNGIRLSQDQQLLLTWGGFKAQVWDSRTGQPATDPITPECNINGATFSQNQQEILTICSEGGPKKIQFWDAQTANFLTKPLGELPDKILFSKDLQSVVGFGDNKALVWNSRTGETISELLEHEASVKGAWLSENHERLITWTDNNAHLWDTRSGKELCPPMEHGQIYKAWLSQNQQRVWTLGDGALRLWDSETGKAMPRLIDKEVIVGVSLSRDGSKMIAWGDGVARVRDNRTGIPLTPSMKHAEMRFARFDKDFKHILTFSNRRVRLWDSYTGELIADHIEYRPSSDWTRIRARFTDKQRPWLTWMDNSVRLLDSRTRHPPTVSIKVPGLKGVMFDQDQQRIFIKGWRKKFGPSMWDSYTGEPLSPPMIHDTEINGALTSPDQTKVLIMGRDRYPEKKGTARLWNVQTGTPITSIISCQSDVCGAVFSPDSQLVLIQGRQWARVWDTRTGHPTTPVMRYKNKYYVKNAKFSPDNQKVLIWGSQWAQVWDSKHTGTPYSPVMELKYDASIANAEFSANGRRVLIWGPRLAQVWESDTGEPLDVSMNRLNTRSVKVIPGQQKVLIWDDRNTVRLWSGFSGMPLSAPIGMQMHQIKGTRLSMDQRRMLIWDAEAVVNLDIHGGEFSYIRLKHKMPIKGAQLSQDNQWVLVWGEHVARVLDSRTGKPVSKLMEQVDIESATFSFDNQRVLIWGDTLARVWDSYTGVPLSTSMVHDDELKGAVFSHDNQRVLTWAGKHVRVRDSVTGKNLALPMIHDHELNEALFTEDQQRILTLGQDSKVKIWNMATDLDFPQEHLVLRLETKIGQKVTEFGDVEEMTDEEWGERWADYEPTAKKHLKQCQYPRANWYLDRVLHNPNSCEKPGDWLKDVNPAKLDEVKEMYAAVCVDRGRMLLDGENYQQAKKRFQIAVHLQPRNSAAYEGLARTLIESGDDPVKGVVYAEQSLELNPYQAPKYALATLVQGYVDIGKDAKAAQTALKLASSYVAWREYKLGLEAYSQAIGLMPEVKDQLNINEYLEALGYLLREMSRKNDLHGRVTTYKQALQIGFTDLKVNAKWANAIARTLIEKEIDIAQGIDYARLSQELDPEQSTKFALNTLALGYIKQGKYDEAITILQDALGNQHSVTLKTTLDHARAAKEAAAEGKYDSQNSPTAPKVIP